MPSISLNNKRIAKNTLFLYGRMLFSLVVSLYTSRVFLSVLGVSDYGVNNVVGGFVTMFAFINNTMATATQRFLNYDLGKNDVDNITRTFETARVIHFALAIIILILLESIGVWFLNHKMNIIPERMPAANWVFQFSVLSLFISIISVPYNAEIIAHEHMSTFAFVGIYEVCAKLVVALVLPFIHFDKLITYSFLFLMIQISIRLFYSLYCRRRFVECKNLFPVYRKEVATKMYSFFGWNTLGAFSYVAREQGVNIVINLFWGTTVNAARAVSSQVTHALYGFISNFQVAMNPQITKNYASGSIDAMKDLVYKGSRFSYYLFYFLALPIFLCTPFVLKVWLKTVPDFTVGFIRFTIVLMLIECLASPIITSLLAVGKIRDYQIISGTLIILNLPLSYLCLYLGFSPVSTVVVAITISFINLIVRILLLRKYAGFSIRDYLLKVLSFVLIVTAISPILPSLYYYFFYDDNWLGFIIVAVLSWLSTGIIIFKVGMSDNERLVVRAAVHKFVSKTC